MNAPAPSASSPSPASAGTFRQGYVMMLPLWLGMMPFAVAYAVTARAAGLSVLDTCFMSLTVFGGASQFAAAGLFGQGAAGLSIVATTFLLNARHLLYGLGLSRHVSLTPAQRAVAAQFLTDEAYGVATVAAESNPANRTFAFLLGAELSLYTVWNLFTLVGAVAGDVLPSPEALGAGAIFPLAFLGLLIPLLTERLTVLVAAVSGLAAWGLSQVLPGGLVILVAGVGGALLGAYAQGRREEAGEAAA